MNISFSVTRRGLLISAVVLGFVAVGTIAVMAFIQARDLKEQLEGAEREVAALTETLEGTSASQYNELASAVTVLQEGTGAMSTTLDKVTERLNKYDECIPELQAQASSASGSWYNDGTVYVFPDASVSRYCSGLLYGDEGGAGIGE